MKGTAYINGNDIWETYRANLLKGTYTALQQGLQTKEFVKNTSRLEDGDRVLVSDMKVSSREVSISFLVEGTDKDEMEQNSDALLKEISTGIVEFKVKKMGRSYFFLLKEISQITTYRKNPYKEIKVKFYEPNPMRTK